MIPMRTRWPALAALTAVLAVASACVPPMPPPAPPAPTPVASAPSPSAAPATAAATTPADGWLTYRDAASGLRFDYPPDAELQRSGDPAGGVIVVGPLVDGERWPSFAINHPADRAAFRPPEGVDLATWLEEHALLEVDMGRPMAEARLPDATIAGSRAIHTRFERSPQSFAYDKYYFARGGQLFQVIIGHTGDREDWALYERFLGSIAVD